MFVNVCVIFSLGIAKLFEDLDTLQWLTDLLYTGRTSVNGIEPNKYILLFFFFFLLFSLQEQLLQII